MEADKIDSQPKIEQGSEPDAAAAHPCPEKAEPSANIITDEERPPSLSKARCIALVMTLTGASFLNVLSTQAVVIIVPVVRNDLKIPESRSQWLVSSYSLTFGCFLLLWGRIGDVVGKRSIFILGTGLATITNIVNPFLGNEIAFNIFRGLAGIAGAANVPTGIGILGVTFTSGKRRNYAFAAHSAGSALGGALGNIVSGFISAYASWKWVFGALAAFGAIITVSAIFLIPSSAPQRENNSYRLLARSVDWLGGFLVTTSLIALLFALTEGNVAGWNNVHIPVLIVIAALLMTTFVIWQWYQEKRTDRAPLMKLSLFRKWRLAAAIATMGMAFGSYNAFFVYATYFWQDYQALSTLQTTFRFIPQGVAGIAVAVSMSFLISRIPTCTLLVYANLAVALSCLLFAIPVSSNVSYFATGFPAMILSVIGVNTVWPCLTLFTSINVPQKDQALGGAIINASGQIGRSIGLAITTALQTGVMAHQRGQPVTKAGVVIPWEETSLVGLRAANWYNFGVQLISSAISLMAFRGTGIIGKIEKRSSTQQLSS